MFTGIVKKVGVIKKIEKERKIVYFTIEAVDFLKQVKIGDSISCDGVCLTIIKKSRNSFTVELIPETLRVTKFKNSKVGDLVNLELALRLVNRIDGHFVMGHIDGIGKIVKVINVGENKDLIIKVPKKIIKYLSYKGSVSVNGVSLTISGVGKDWFKVNLITHTLKNTNLRGLKTGDKVNIEVDMIAKYLEKLIDK